MGRTFSCSSDVTDGLRQHRINGCLLYTSWIASTGKVDYTLDGETKTGMQFEIPVEALDQEFAVAAHAVKSGKWYDRAITIASSSLKKTGDLPSDDNKGDTPKPTLVPTKTPTVSPSETPVVKPTSTPTPAPTQKPADTKPCLLYTSELLADDKVWSRTTGTAKNQVHAEYLEGEDDMTVSFDVYYQCEGSCGEYFADITVTDSETGKLYYSSEAENEAAE